MQHVRQVAGATGNILAIQQHAAGARRCEARDHMEQRGLAAPGGTEQTGDLAGLDVERHVTKHVNLAEPL